MAKSGIQKEVLSLYRASLRAIRRKPEDTHHHWYLFVREQYDAHRTLRKKDFATIEYHLRMGWRKLDMYGADGVRDIHVDST
ncbi:hypothetical protein PYCC9005_000241 [Savitreella phatthalungensis]